MYDQGGTSDLPPAAHFHNSGKSPKAPSGKFLPAFPARKRQRTAAVYPRLILRHAGQFFIIPILEFSEITLCQFLHHYISLLRINQFCRLNTAFHRTYKYCLRLRICSGAKQFHSFLTQPFIRTPDITPFQIPGRERMADQIQPHPLITVPAPQTTRYT